MRPRIVMAARAAAFVLSAAGRSPGTETGGILIGYREDEDLVVSHAFEVPSALRSHDRYVRSGELAGEILGEFLHGRDPVDPEGYIGEWHSHPGSPGPSSIDSKAIRELAVMVEGTLALVVARLGQVPPLLGVAGTFRHGRSRAIPSHILIQEPLPTTKENLNVQ